MVAPMAWVQGILKSDGQTGLRPYQEFFKVDRVNGVNNNPAKRGKTTVQAYEKSFERFYRLHKQTS